MSLKYSPFVGIFILLLSPALSSGHSISPDIVKYSSSLQVNSRGADQELHRRNEGRTLFSFPEWYIVYSAQEYAEFVSNGQNPSDFPYLDAMNQFWESAYKVKEASGDTYALNKETKTVLNTIGISFSLENILTAFYESTIGRISYALNLFRKSPEDRFNDKVAHEYAEFLNQTPWYEFPYFKKYTELWTKVYGINSLSIRGLERRAILSVSYLFKGVYGAIIKKLARANYDEAGLETKFIVKNISDNTLKEIKNIKIVQISNNQTEAKTIRYRAFKDVALEIINVGGEFVSIEDNETIMITVVTEKENECIQNTGKKIFTMPILTRKTLERSALLVYVSELNNLKKTLEGCNVTFEHIYDY